MSDNYEREQFEGGDDDLKNRYADDLEGFSMKEGGIVREGRGCTDIFCLLLFVVAMLSMAGLGYYGQMHGDVGRLLAPLDAELHFCGHEPGFEEYPKLFITDFSLTNIMSLFKSGVCVKKCPEEGDTAVECMPAGDVKDCNDEKIIKNIFATRSMLDFCVPAHLDAVPDEIKEGFAMFKANLAENPIGKYIYDLYLSSRAIYASIGTGVIICFVYIQIMSAFAETISWICVLLMQIGLLAATYGLWYLREQNVNSLAAFIGEHPDQLETKEQQEFQQLFLLVLVAVVGTMALAFLCCTVCFYKHLAFAIDVIDASADFLASTKRIILVPALYFILSIVAILIWTGCIVCVIALNEVEANPLIPQAKQIIWDDTVVYLSLWMLFAILWLTAWLEYTSTFIILVSASTYYFNSNSAEEGSAEVALGFDFAYNNHPGSLAFGSFIIALIRFIRIVFVYIAKELQKKSGDNPVVKYVVVCANCVLACLEKICDYINEAAYAYMAVTGDSFCNAAWYGFLLNVKHMLKFTFANTIAKVFTFIGKIAITVGNMFVCYNIMKYYTHDVEEVSSIFGPLSCVGVITYITASIFLGLFDHVVMALMTCLAIDMDVNGGEPAFGPPTFHSKVNEIDKKSKVHIDGGGMYDDEFTKEEE